ncbi:MAG: flagellar hook-basal body complex protein [Desulfohalobiaceae bacterium]|nr:flagellar hook-basal body complex protein [Desulfohalobiaceae bacterium]
MGLGGAMNSGISGLQSFSNAMSVIGNNLANTNTTGFKSSRTLFADLIPDNVTGTGGTNQIGRGSTLSRVDNIFTQGSIESTSSNTDLAIEGPGFFMVRNPDSQATYFTRAGTFRLDQGGDLTNPEGFVVQGFERQADGSFSDLINDVHINTRSFVPAQASSEVALTTNLNAQSETSAWDLNDPVTTSNFATTTEVYDSLGNTHLITSYFNKTGDNTWEYHQTVPAEEIGNSGGNPTDGLARISGTEVTGTLAAGDLIVNGNDVGAVGSQDAAAIAAAIGTADASVSAAASNSVTLNINEDSLADNDGADTNLSHISFDLTLDGTTNTVTFDAANDGDGITAADIAAAIDNQFAAGTAGLSGTGITLTSSDGSNIEIANLDIQNVADDANSGLADGTTYGSIELSSSADIVLGGNNEAKAGFTDGATGLFEPTMVEVASGSFSFDSQGLLSQITTDGGSTITAEDAAWPRVTIAAENLDWANGADQDQSVDYELNLTQFATDSRVVTQEANGYSSGNLSDISVDSEGTITGIYSNGEMRDLARLALGKFSNNNGLAKIGKNLFQATNLSGPPDVGTAGSGVGKIYSNSLEQSTVDIAEEFTKMITTQRSFQANSKTITTTDEMLNEVINLKR